MTTTTETIHKSDCALHNGPALPVGPCTCGAVEGVCRQDSARASGCKERPDWAVILPDGESAIACDRHLADVCDFTGAKNRVWMIR